MYKKKRRSKLRRSTSAAGFSKPPSRSTESKRNFQIYSWIREHQILSGLAGAIFLGVVPFFLYIKNGTPERHNDGPLSSKYPGDAMNEGVYLNRPSTPEIGVESEIDKPTQVVRTNGNRKTVLLTYDSLSQSQLLQEIHEDLGSSRFKSVVTALEYLKPANVRDREILLAFNKVIKKGKFGIAEDLIKMVKDYDQREKMEEELSLEYIKERNP